MHISYKYALDQIQIVPSNKKQLPQGAIGTQPANSQIGEKDGKSNL